MKALDAEPLIMSDKQRELARHALGLPNPKNISYRNHFCVPPGGDGYAEWRDLESKGLAVQCEHRLFNGQFLFHLTLEGARRAREPKEKISRERVMNWRRIK